MQGGDGRDSGVKPSPEPAVAMIRKEANMQCYNNVRVSSAHFAGGVVPQSKALSQR